MRNLNLAATAAFLFFIAGSRVGWGASGPCTYFIQHKFEKGARVDDALVKAVNRFVALREKENNEVPFVSYPNSWCQGDRFPLYQDASYIHGKWGEPGSAMLYKVRWLKASASGSVSLRFEIYVFDRPRFRRVANSGPVRFEIKKDDVPETLPKRIAEAIAIYSHGV